MAQVEGVAGLKKALEQKTKNIVAAAERATDESAKAVRDDMRRNMPVSDVGHKHLRDAIEVRKRGALQREVGVFDPKFYYFIFVEHGTSIRPAHPVAVPAAERERRRYPQRVAEAVNKELR